jgi:hypothetical protein
MTKEKVSFYGALSNRLKLMLIRRGMLRIDGTSEPKTHELKVHFDFWFPLERGEKPFEIRYNDRGFQVGDRLVLRPVALTNGHDDTSDAWVYVTGKNGTVPELRRRVTYILRPSQHPGLKDGYVILGLAND